MLFGNSVRACLPGLCAAMMLMLSQPCAPAKEGFKPFALRTLNGEHKALRDFLNRATLVTFFFPTCSYCNGEMPSLQKLYETYRDRGFSMVAINIVSEQDSMVAGWQATHHYTFPVLVGAKLGPLQKSYDIRTTPTHFLLDAKGEVILKQTGYKGGDEKVLEQHIEKALSSQP